MFYVVVYDIPESEGTLRERIAKILQDYGLIRVQYSVFTGTLSKNQMEMAMLEILEEIDNKSGDVKVFPVIDGKNIGIHIQDGNIQYVTWKNELPSVISI